MLAYLHRHCLQCSKKTNVRVANIVSSASTTLFREPYFENLNNLNNRSIIKMWRLLIKKKGNGAYSCARGRQLSEFLMIDDECLIQWKSIISKRNIACGREPTARLSEGGSVEWWRSMRKHGNDLCWKHEGLAHFFALRNGKKQVYEIL
jgi:hypothetical protein